MDIIQIQEQLDQLYEKKNMDNVYTFLIENTYQAMQNNDDSLVLFLLNELIGYDRVTARFKEGEQIARQIIKILESRGLSENINGATSYLNIATLYRAEGKYQEALTFYLKTEKIYHLYLSKNDERYGAFYNNFSLLYMEIGDYQKALQYSMKALQIIENLDDCRVEEATTYVNMSQILMTLNDKENALSTLQQGMAMFEKYAPHDPHYFAALSSLAQYYYENENYQKAIDIYDDVLEKIEGMFGQNKDYHIVLSNQEKVKEALKHQKMNGMILSKKYYESFGKPMIENKFSSYQKYMAVGIFGFGSECLGYDDDISTDHDHGPGFCIWLPQDIYLQIGQDLQKEYDLLPQEYLGYKRQVSRQGQGRVGVFSIEEFFQSFLYQIPDSLEAWLYADENALLAVTNGQIFEDNYGLVTKIRKQLTYYPEDIRIKKIVRAIAKMAQSGQYNYARCMKRHQEVAAYLALSEFVNQTLSVIYLLNKRYKPYYKWSFYGLKDCPLLKDVQPLLEELISLPSQSNQWNQVESDINLSDKKVMIIEKICQFIVKELQRQGLTSREDDFLENHTIEIMSHIQDIKIKSKHVMEG